MRQAWVMSCVLACGGGNSPVADAPPADAEIDADIDTDGDGVLDGVDVCPGIADPAQVDLDGDGDGWLCDPIETATFAYQGIPNYFRLAVRGTTLGAAFTACDGAACVNRAISVGPDGVAEASSSSDTWLSSRVERGWGAGENHVLWSFVDRGIGDQSAASNAFTSRYDGLLSGGDLIGTKRFERDDLIVLPSHSPTQGYALLEPRSTGEVHVIAESARDYAVAVITGHDPAHLVFSLSTFTGDSLQRFVPGAAASETVMAGATALSSIFEARTVEAGGAVAGICVVQAAARYWIATDDNTTPGQPLPLPSCNLSAAMTTDRRLKVLVANVDGGHPTGASAFVLDGVVHSLSSSTLPTEVVGHSLPAVVRTTNKIPPPSELAGIQTLDAIDSLGTVHPIADDVKRSIVSTEGETIHVLADRGSDRVLFRYRNGTTSEVTLPAFTATPEEIVLFTTKEGAALISTPSATFVVPSQSMVPAAIDFKNLRGIVRGDATLFVATTLGASAMPALYAYVEVGGVPQSISLAPEATTNLYAYPLDHEATRTKWFAFVRDGVCLLARPEVAGATVTLAGNVPCLAGAVIDGVTRDNKWIVRVADNVALEQLYLLEGDSMTKVASSAMQFRLLYAAPGSRVALGWIGSGFVCLGTHPERCWPSPFATHEWAAPMPGQPDSLHVGYMKQLSGMIELTSIKAIGPGTLPQPL